MTELLWNKEFYENKKNKNKKKKNKNNSRFCHFPVQYLAGVVDAY